MPPPPTANSCADPKGNNAPSLIGDYFRLRYGTRAQNGKIILSFGPDDHNYEMYPLVSDEQLLAAPRARMLWTACQNMEDRQRLLLKDDAKARKAIVNLVRTLKNYPHLHNLFFGKKEGSLYSADDTQLIRQTGVFHEVAGESCIRKHTGNRAVHHSYRVVNNAQAYALIAYGRTLPMRYVASVLLHDDKEDFKTSLNQIRAMCGEGVARNVQPVTIPETDELEDLFPKVVAKWREDEQKKKATLKHLYKMYSAPSYYFINILTKFWDGIDIIDSYYREIRDGRIVVATCKENTKNPEGTPIISRSWLRRNLKERFVFNQLMMYRLMEIRQDRVMNSEKFDCLRLINDMACIFALNSQGLIKAAALDAPSLLARQIEYASDYLKNPAEYVHKCRRLKFPDDFYGKTHNGKPIPRRNSAVPDIKSPVQGLCNAPHRPNSSPLNILPHCVT